MKANPILNAIAAALYIAGIVFAVSLTNGYQGETIFIHMLVLSLLVLSVAVMGYLFFFQPVVLFLEGHRQAGIVFFFKTIAAFVVCVAIFAALVLAFSAPSSDAAEQYVNEHIATLSPDEPVLGGTWHVTDIQAEDGKGTVHYEDGHIARTADFTYEGTWSGVEITSFTLRSE